MNSSFESWMKLAAEARGVLACGVQFRDRSVLGKTNRAELTKAKVEQALKKMFDTVLLLQQNQIPAECLRWTFEDGQLRCAVRPDGHMAAVLVHSAIVQELEIEKVFAAFLSLDKPEAAILEKNLKVFDPSGPV